MEDRTFTYLTGRFRDYYGEVNLTLPPEIENREWGYIPWNNDGKTFMRRHLSLLEIGDPHEFLPSEFPRHIYTNAAKYEDPSASTMEEKRWESSDLIFDIDIDDGHLPEYIDADSLSYADELGLAKTHLIRLLTILDDEFGFEDMEVVFSGGRGYHVHVRDPGVQSLTSKQRTELVSYIQGVNLDLDTIVQSGLSTVSTKAGDEALFFKQDGGWGNRAHERLVSIVDDYRAIAEQDGMEEAASQLSDGFSGVGEKNSKALVKVFVEKHNLIRAGQVNVVPGMKTFVNTVVESVRDSTYADIDEPVTTDINRLIRLPGSLHGKTGMRVTRIPRDEIESFNPLIDAVPEKFTKQEIAVRVTEETSVRMLGDNYEFEEGEEYAVVEAVGLYLMAQGLAEKEQE